MQQFLTLLARGVRRCGWALLLTLAGQFSFNPPEARAQAQPQVLFTVSAATLKDGPLAPGSLVTLFGARLATTTASATDTDPQQPGVQLPISLGGTTVRVDGQLAQLLFVSPQQVNCLLPESLSPSTTYESSLLIEVLAGDGTRSVDNPLFAPVAPGVFTANSSGKGLPAGVVLRVRADGTRANEPLFTVVNGVVVPRPLDFGVPGDRLFLTLFATGLRNAPDANRDGNLNEQVRVLANGYETTPAFAGAVSPGVEQINLEVPRTFLGLTRLRLAIEVEGVTFTPQELEVPLALPPLSPLAWRAAGLEGKRVNSLLGVDLVTLAGTDEGIFHARHGGNDWKLADYVFRPGILRTNALIATTVPTYFSESWLAGLDDTGVWSALDEQGQLWISTPISTFPLLTNKTVRAFAVNSTYVFAGGDDLGVVRLRCCYEPWQRAGEVFAPRVNALAANGARVIAGTAANGLYLSNDNGNIWAQQNSGVPVTAEVRALLNAGATWLAGAANGLYRSTDNGVTWTRVLDGLPATAAVNALHAYGNALLAGTAADGVLVSTDGGARWQAANAGLTNQNVLALGNGGNRLWAGTTAGVFAATIIPNVNQPPLAEAQQLTLDEDSTKAFTLRGSDPDGDALTYSIVRGPEHGYLRGAGANLVYAPEADFYGADQFSFRANDGKLGSRAATVSLTINPLNDPPQIDFSGDRLLLTGQFTNLVIQLSDPDWLGAGQPPKLTLTATGLPEGARISASQTFITIPGQPFDTRRLIWVSSAPGTYTINFTVSDDSTPPLSTTQAVTLRVADNPEKGAWTPVNSPIRLPRTDLISNLFADGADLYAVTNELPVLGSPAPPAGFWRSSDGGATWKDARNSLLGTPQVLARAGNALFAGTDQGMFRSPLPSADGAPVWTAVNNGLPALRSINSITVRGDKLVVATPFALFLSTNKGASWTSINGNLPLTGPPGDQPFVISAVVTSVVFNGDTLFASIIGRLGGILATAVPDPAEVEAAFNTSETNGQAAADAAQQAAPIEGVFRSTDNGATWTPVNSGLGVPISGLGQVFAVSSLTVGGTTLYANGAFGLFRSTNQGERWQRVPTPFPNLLSVPIISFSALRQALAANQTGAAPQTLLNQIIGLPAPLLPLLPPVVVNGKLYLAPYGRGVYTSRDDGSDWLPISQGLDEPTQSQLFAAGNRLYCVTSNFGVGIGLGGQTSPSTRIFTRTL